MKNGGNASSVAVVKLGDGVRCAAFGPSGEQTGGAGMRNNVDTAVVLVLGVEGGSLAVSAQNVTI